MMSFRSARSWCWEYRTFRLPDLWALWVRGGGRRQNLRGPNTPPNRQPFASSNLILRHFQHHTGFAAFRNDFCDTLEIAISRRIHQDLHLTNVQKPTCLNQAFGSPDAMAVPARLASRASLQIAFFLSSHASITSIYFYSILQLLLSCFEIPTQCSLAPHDIIHKEKIALPAMTLFNPKHIPECSKVPLFRSKKKKKTSSLSRSLKS